MLTQRQEAILELVVDEYIESATPVSSRLLASRQELPLSSATIRNELAQLEENGYITHPYTSAGRIPSDQGYRHYVESLMDEKPLSFDEKRTIEHQLHQVNGGFDQWLSLTATILSTTVGGIAIVIRPSAETTSLKHVQLVELNGTSVMLVVVMNNGFIGQKILNLSRPYLQNELNSYAEELNQNLKQPTSEQNGKSNSINNKIDDSIILDAIFQLSINQQGQNETYLEGLSTVLNQPEFTNVHRMREAIENLDTYHLRMLIEHSPKAEPGTTHVLIGEEHGDELMREWSIIVSSFGDNISNGTVAVLGPTRMDYPRSIPRVRYIAELMSALMYEVR